ncbi:MAG TPA: glycosyltransferase family 4 protein [Verrucomicrobiae bacterium]|nr:glycosyltransferase family 4 protein [Verrucomicrobiae bacterium]
MRILYTECSPNFGGKELRILEEMEWFQRRGHDVRLAAANGSAIQAAAAERGLKVVPVKFRGSFNPSVIPRLLAACWNHGTQLIVTHDSRDTTNAWPSAKILGLPLIRYQMICKPLKGGFVHKMVWRHTADDIVAVSESIRRRLINHRLAAHDDVRVVGEYVDTEIFHPQVPPGDVRARYGIPEDGKLIVHIGMIRPDKGQHLLVSAADKILETHPDCWFMFVGGPIRTQFLDDLEKCIHDIRRPERIIVAGFQKEVAPYIAAGNIVCLTSLLEAQSKVIPQAFAMRKLVVAPDTGGIPELIQHRRNGLLYAGGDPEALVAAVNEALADKSEILAARGYELAQAMDINRIMTQTEKLYETWIYDTALDSRGDVSPRQPPRRRFHHRKRGKISAANGMAAARKLPDARRGNIFARLARRISSAAALLRHHV